MKVLSLLIVLGATQVGVAQSLTPPAWSSLDQTIQDILQRVHDKAYDASSGITGLSFRMSGVTRVGNGVTGTRQSWAYYRYAPDGGPNGKADLKFNLLNFHYDASGNIHTESEVVEDGKTMWHYVPDAKTYSVATYDITGPNDPTPATYISDALNAANLSVPATGGPSYVTRLLREMFVTYDPGANATSTHFYHPWVITPGGPSSMPGPYKDVLTALYRDSSTGLETVARPTRDPNVYYVVYQNSLAGSPTKVMSFEIYVDPNLPDGDPDRQAIRRIYITESTPQNMLAPTGLRRKTVFNTWSIEVQPTTDFSGARFTPVTRAEVPDLAQWRPLVIPNPAKG